MICSFWKKKTTQKGPRMLILHDILGKLKSEFSHSRKGEERGAWFVYSLVAIIIPFTSSKTSNLLRCLRSFFGFPGIGRKRDYTFMASPKIPWRRLWRSLWKMIPAPLTDGRLMLAINDYIPKPEKRVFGAPAACGGRWAQHLQPVAFVAPELRSLRRSRRAS